MAIDDVARSRRTSNEKRTARARRHGIPLPVATIVALLPPILFLWVVVFVSPTSAAGNMTFTVNSTLDEPDASSTDLQCQSTPSGVCTLRAAVEQALKPGGFNPWTTATIVVPAGTYTLTAGQLNILANLASLDIQGAGPSATIIDGNGQNPNCYPATALSCRIFDMKTGSTLSASGMTIRNGRAGIGEASHYHGGAIHNHGSLALRNVVVSNSIVTAAAWGGGGITNAGGAFADLENVTIAGNKAKANGGGIENLGGLSTRISTISNNIAEGSGGGIWHNSSTGSSIRYVTVANNTASTGGGGIHRAGGVAFYSTDSILSSNVGTNCAGTVASFGGFNVSSDASCAFAQAGDKNSTDPLLGSLQYNGGSLPTRLPASNSPAIDIRTTDCGGTDQRGIDRPQGAGCDAGAVEVRIFNFADVPIGHWARNQIFAFAQRGITTGCDASNYCPERPVTRAEMAVFLNRNLGFSTPITPAVQRFSDVPSSYWAFAHIDQFAKLGITTGCGGTEFCPERGVTRAEMAAFLIRALNQSQLTPATPTFADVPTTHPQYSYIETLVNIGVTTGCGTDGQGRKLYCPDRGVTRAEMAVFIIRAFP